MPRKRSEPSRSSAKPRAGRRGNAAEPAEIIWLPAAVAALVASRFFLPAESAAQGETLWIVLLWLLCGVVWLFTVSRHGGTLRRPDGLVVGIALLAGGHVISALAVLLTEGDKRSALNMLWEWVGIGVAAMLIRAVLRTRPGRDQLLSVILTSGVVLAGLGLWQHFVWYPRIASQFAELESLEDELQRTEPSGDAATMRSRLRRLETLRREMGWTPGEDGASERMFRDRVQASTEPIGRFALANTFAGLLLVAGFLGLGAVIVAVLRRKPFLKGSGTLAGLLIVGYCLWLTKSRTAWVGIIGGLAVLGLSARRQHFARGPMRWVFVGVAVVLVGMPVAAALSGSLDRQVLSEAPKSLLYRVEYWRATGRLIADHPLLGVGPGNFRQHYLQYKLPGSSEEILDPHNLLLDVWANGGLIAVAGLLCLLGIVAKRIWDGPAKADRFDANEADGETDEHQPSATQRGLRLGGIGTASLVLAAGCELLGGTIGGGQWFLLGLGWWGAALAISAGARLAAVGPALTAALVGLVIHLTGAGGIAMPAILQVLLILIIAVADPLATERSGVVAEARMQRTGPSSLGPWAVPTMLLTCLALLSACLMTATIPVTKATATMNMGRAEWLIDGQPLAAERDFRQAAGDDPLSPDPWQELASVRFARWMRTFDADDFQQAIAAQREAIARDPMNAGRWRTLAQLWTRRYEHEPKPEFARAAYEAMQVAVRRYPHLAAAQAELAVAARQAGEMARAREAAQAALRLDDTNRQRGHVDKYLTNDQRTELRTLLPNNDVSAAK